MAYPSLAAASGTLWGQGVSQSVQSRFPRHSVSSDKHVLFVCYTNLTRGQVYSGCKYMPFKCQENFAKKDGYLQGCVIGCQVIQQLHVPVPRRQ